MEGYTDGPTRTFQEETLGAFDNKQNLLVKQASAANEIMLAAATTDHPIGVCQSKLHDGSLDVPVRLLNAGGTVKITLGGTVALGAAVMPTTAGKVLTHSGSTRVVGRVLQAGVANDVVEMYASEAGGT